MNAFESRFHRLLATKIDTAIDEHARSLAAGGAADFAAYRLAVGFVQGLRAARELADLVHDEINQ